jgi:hypothetical protein
MSFSADKRPKRLHGRACFVRFGPTPDEYVGRNAPEADVKRD